MLPEIKLDTENFQDLLEEYRAMIAGIYPEWTNYNYHDPGMTFLELFAWLTENQQFHMEQLGDEHYARFFRLLAFQRKKLCPASVLAMPRECNPMRIAPKSRFLAGGMVFETVEEENLPGDSLMGAAVFCRDGKKIGEVGRHQLSCVGEMRFYPFGTMPKVGTECRFYFSEPLNPERDYHLYIQLDKNKTPFADKERRTERNPLQDEVFFPLAKLEWSAYSSGGWQPAEVKRDETSQFLFDGRIHFSLTGEMAPLLEDGGFYALRVVLKENDYDFAPVFSGVTMNLLFLEQKETWEGKEFFLAEGNGFPCQSYDLPWQMVMADSVHLEAEDPLFPGIYQKWRMVESFSGCSPEDLCYQVDEEKGRICFGDGFLGMAPEGKIRITAMERTWGEGCTVKEKTPMLWDGRDFFVFCSRKKGSSPESIENALYRLGTEKLERRRAVTAADYEAAVKKTPGLMIYSCKVLGEISINNQVAIVVRPGDEKHRLPLSAAYRKNILHFLDRQRMMGTRIQLYGPEYIEVFVYLEVSVMPQFLRAREMVIHAVEEFFSLLGASFGVLVSYGELYGKIDSMDCVRRLHSLNLTARSAGVSRNQGGDLIPPANGVFLLEQVEFISIHD